MRLIAICGLLLTVLFSTSRAQVILHEDFESGRLDSTLWETNVNSPERGGVESRPGFIHSGKYSFRCTSLANSGNASGTNIRYFFLPGVDKAYFRWYAMFDKDFNQGRFMHWCVISCSRTDNKWSAFGQAGLRPKGDDFAVTNLEPAVDNFKYPPPGVMGFYTYWPGMTIDPDGIHYYGNRFEPETPFQIERGRWYCFEVMFKLNRVGKSDGEQAFWVDGREIYHQEGIAWRASDILKVNSLSLDVYIHHAARDNTCWFDDVEISTNYIGPLPGGK